MLKTWTNIVLDLLDTVQENRKWDTEKCPGAVALKAKEGKGVDCEAAEAEFSTCHKAAKERSVPSHYNHIRLFFHLFVTQENHI